MPPNAPLPPKGGCPLPPKGGQQLYKTKTMAKTKVTKQQLAEWEAKHEVFELPVDDKTGYLRAPEMSDYKRAMTAMQKNGEVAFGEEMLNALWLGGDEEIKTDDAYFLPARNELLGFLNYEDAEIKALGDGKSEIRINGHKCIVRAITRNDLKVAEKKNPGNKVFVTQENLFAMVCLEKDKAFGDKQNADMRFPLFQAIEKLQKQKTAFLKKRSPGPS